MAADVTLTINADTAKAIKELVKFTQSVDRVEKTGKKTNGMFQKMALSWKDIATLTVGFSSVNGAIQAGINGLREWNDQLKLISTKQKSVAASAIPLYTLLGPKAVKEAHLLGAESGLMPTEAAPIYQELASLSGMKTHENGVARAFKEAADLINLKATPEGATRFMKLAADPRKGLSPEKVGAMAYQAAKMAGLTLTEYSEQSGAIGSYKDPFAGAAVLSGLSEMSDFSKEQLNTFLMQLPKTFADTNNKFMAGMVKTARKQGIDWQDMDEIDRLKFIRANVQDTSFEGLTRGGMTLEREARALSAAIGNLDAILEKYAAIAAAPTNLTDVELANLRRNIPRAQEEFVDRQSKAVQAARQYYGPTADMAANRDMNAALMAAEGGYVGFNIDQETARATKARWLFNTLMEAMEPAASTGYGVPKSQAQIAQITAQQPPAVERLEATNEAILQQLREIADNTKPSNARQVVDRQAGIE